MRCMELRVPIPSLPDDTTTKLTTDITSILDSTRNVRDTIAESVHHNNSCMILYIANIVVVNNEILASDGFGNPQTPFVFVGE